MSIAEHPGAPTPDRAPSLHTMPQCPAPVLAADVSLEGPRGGSSASVIHRVLPERARLFLAPASAAAARPSRRGADRGALYPWFWVCW
jgi:hypothetical protein